MPFLNSFCSDKLNDNANLKFCDVKISVSYKFMGKLENNYANSKISNDFRPVDR